MRPRSQAQPASPRRTKAAPSRRRSRRHPVTSKFAKVSCPSRGRSRFGRSRVSASASPAPKEKLA